MFVVALFFIEPSRKKLQDAQVLTGIIRVVKYCFRHQKIFGLMLLYAVLLTTGLVSVWGYLLKLQKSGLTYYVNGFGFALFQAASAFGALLSHRITRSIGVKNSYRLLLLIPFFLVLQTVNSSQYLLLFSFPHAFVWGFSLPFFLYEINHLISSDIRATALSTGSMFGRMMFVLAAPFTGWLFDKYSSSAGFVFLAGLFLIFAFGSAIKRNS